MPSWVTIRAGNMHVSSMIAAWTHAWWHISGPAMDSVLRLFVATLLGGAIGLERELKHRPSGLRTNLLICFGSAMFTLLSYRLVEAFSSGADPTRIAAQIIPGIGFIGAGSILRDKAGVSGLTSAATIFVVAGIGMAAGAGLYQTAFFSTLLVLACLLILGSVETRYDLKPIVVSYDIISGQCESSEPLIAELNRLLDQIGVSMQTVRILSTGDQQCHVQFSVETFRTKQRQLVAKLKDLPSVTTMAATSLGQRD
jgi:putative Mg2+ transporter-C (MgtC) family protein